jgi:hypothetical protein
MPLPCLLSWLSIIYIPRAMAKRRGDFQKTVRLLRVTTAVLCLPIYAYPANWRDDGTNSVDGEVLPSFPQKVSDYLMATTAVERPQGKTV